MVQRLEQRGNMDPPNPAPLRPFVTRRDQVCRTDIRPLPSQFQDCEYNEHLNNKIVHFTARNFHEGTADAARHPGIGSAANSLPYETVQTLLIPARQQ